MSAESPAGLFRLRLRAFGFFEFRSCDCPPTAKHRVHVISLRHVKSDLVRRGDFMPALDGLRGVAILWVVLHNSSAIDEPLPGVLGHVITFGVEAGWAGVTLFFALSGFLITGILLDSDSTKGQLRNFYGRRVLRIFPLYYGVLFAGFVIWPLFGQVPESLTIDAAHQFWLWAYLSNWTLPFGIASTAFPHFWSLAVEEQFYLVWPFLLRARSPQAVLKLCLGVAVAALAVRCAMTGYGASPEMLYTFTVTRMDALALGGAAAAVLRIPVLQHRAQAHAGHLMLVALATWLCCLLLLNGLPRLSPLSQTLGYSLLALSFSTLVLALAIADRTGNVAWWSKVWRIAPLRVLARYSYGIYVFHAIIARSIGKPFMHSQPSTVLESIPAHLVYLGSCTLLSLGAAMLSYHCVEIQFLRLKTRFR